MPSFANRVSRRFSTTAAGGADSDITHEVTADATIEKVTVRFYPGPLLDLELRPFIEPEEGQRADLVDVIGRDRIVGDDDVFEFYVSEPIEEGDTIGVEYENLDPSNSYDFSVDMEVDRIGGLNRVTRFVRGLI